MSAPTRPARAAAPPLRIEAADADALPLVHAWAEANSWAPGGHDFQCYLDTDPGSLHVGYLGEEPVAAVFVANHDACFAHLGAYMVPAQHRGNGFGLATFTAALKHAGDRVVGLHAVTDQVANYMRSGFVAHYSTWRFSGSLSAASGTPGGPAGRVVGAAEVDLADLVDYDARHFRAVRPGFLRSWIDSPGHVAKAVLDADGAVAGLGVIRPTTGPARIGPLLARDTPIATALLHALAEEAGAADVALDVPEVNPAACDLAAALGLRPEFEMVTMFTPGPLKPLAERGVYAVASAELG
jgi:GNAT superfamily N-acetyltransferase